ncbi:MAG: hypothetical protein JWM68_846 [Verrucomicrobiales bacterium]|nr:hypothetical protein [Verrucomicrobiales bacterium]
MTNEQANSFAKEWIESWNNHDLEQVLGHYTDDVEMSSPFAAKFTGEPSGRLSGKEALRVYWRTALEKLPDLHFELIEVFAGASSIALHYRTNFGYLTVEVLFFNAQGIVYRAAAHYREIP